MNDRHSKSSEESNSDELNKLNSNSSDNIVNMMSKNYSHPEPNDPDLLYKLMKKRELYYHHMPERPELNSYQDIHEYRSNVCERSFVLHEHQALLSNFINPDTPYKGILVFHGLGSGKCVTKETLICVNNKIERIENLWNDNYCKSNIGYTIDNEGGEWLSPIGKYLVNSINESTGKIVEGTISNV